MHIIDTEIVPATLYGGQTGLRVVFSGEGGECVTVEMATIDGVTAEADAVSRAKAILIQTATFGLASNEYDKQSNGDFDEVSVNTATDGTDTVFMFEYRDGGIVQRLPEAMLPSAEVAREEALRCAMEVLLDLQPGKDDLTGWLVRVSDQNGQLLFTVDVSDAEAARHASELA